jgi:hypothetical protein
MNTESVVYTVARGSRYLPHVNASFVKMLSTFIDAGYDVYQSDPDRLDECIWTIEFENEAEAAIFRLRFS